MEDFYNKTHYTEEDLNNLIRDKVEEGLYLDFKRAEALGPADLIKKEISKDVSSFANTNGGIIIYGIKEENNVATELSFINGNEFTKEKLEHIINGNIQRRISDLEIHPIRFDGETTKTVYIVKIPESIDAPHMAKDNKFYKRFNFESIPMNEYEIRNIYNRKSRTSLEIISPILTSGGSTGAFPNFRELDVELKIKFKNIGRVIEDKIKIELSLPKNVVVSGNTQLNIKNNLVRSENDYNIYTFVFNENLFPEEINILGGLKLKYTRQSYMSLRDKFIKVILYFSGGNDEKEYSLNEFLKYNNCLLQLNNFIDN